MTRSEVFIKRYRKSLDSGRDYYNPDTSYQPIEEFAKAKTKLMIIFPSSSDVKSVSSTKEAINDYVISHCLGTFVDFSYLPDKNDIKLYDKYNIPYAVGHITHLDPSHFDFVGYSISVLSENMTMANVQKSLSRCDTPIPLTWSERKDTRIGVHPIVFMGGITAAYGDILYGDIGDGRIAFPDFTYLGACDEMNELFVRHQDIMENPDTRIRTSNQDYIESLFDLEFIYHPQAYEVVYYRGVIVSNTKINPKALDFVTPCYPKVLPDDLGLGRTILNANGAAAGVSQIQISEGCSSGGACNFSVAAGTRIWTDQGAVKIETQLGKQALTVQAISIEQSKDILKQESDYKNQVRYNSGAYLNCHDLHKHRVIENGILVRKLTNELQKGDTVLKKLGTDFEDSLQYVKDNNGKELDESLAFLLGFIHGDGSVRLRPNGKYQIRVFMDSDEWKYLEPVLLREFGKTDAVRDNHIKGKDIFILSKNEYLEDIFTRDLCIASNYFTTYVPDAVFESPVSVIKSYLGGLFQADGSSGRHIRLTTVSETLARDVLFLLNYIGIDAIVKPMDRINTERKWKWNSSTAYVVTVKSLYNNKFRTEIGFINKSNNVKESTGQGANGLVPNSVLLNSLIRKEFKSHDLRDQSLGSLHELYSDKNKFLTVRTLLKFKELYPKFKFPEVYELIATGKFVPDFIEEVKRTNELVEMYDVLETVTHTCIYNQILTEQCAEGWYTGAWREQPIEAIKRQAWESKKYSAGYKIKPFSFNSLSVESLIPIGNGLFSKGSNLRDVAGAKVIGLNGKSKVFESTHYGIKELLAIRMSQGPGIEVTPEHRQTVLTKEGLSDIQSSLLGIGDWIPQQVGYYIAHAKEALSETVAYKLGLWYGDGYSAGNSNYIAVNKFETNLDGHVKAFSTSKLVNDNDNVNRYLLPADITKEIRRVFPHYKSKENLTSLFSLDEWVDFIKGWFDADGCTSGGFIKLTAKEDNLFMLKRASVVLGSIGIRTVLSKPIRIQLEVKGKWYTRRDLYVTGLESRQSFMRLIRFTEPKNNSVKIESTKWSDKDKCIPGVFGQWVFEELKKIGEEKGHNASKFFNGKKGMTLVRFTELFGHLDIEPVRLVKSGVRFAQILDIELKEESEVVDVLEAEEGRWVANGYVTHNCNYVTDFTGMLHELMQIFPTVNFINMRLEELGHTPDHLKIMKLIGANRISAPVEGISDRIRNGLLNKNLSLESLNAFMDFLISLKMTDIKVGGIATQYEEPEDWEEILLFLKNLKDKAHSWGKKVPIRFNFCLTADALTPVPGQGLLRQNEIKEGLIEGHKTSEVTKLIPQGICEIKKLHTKEGFSIKGTHEHPVLVDYENPENPESYKFIKDFKKGEKAYVRVGTEAYGADLKYMAFDTKFILKQRKNRINGVTLTAELAEVLGWWTGDGYISQDYKQFGLCYNLSELDIKDRHESMLINHGLVSRTVEGKSIHKLIVSNIALGRYITKVFGKGFDGKVVPSVILESPKEVQCAYLKGLFSADGTIGNYYIDGDQTFQMIRLNMSNRPVTKTVQVMLANIGIFSSLTVCAIGRKTPKWTVKVAQHHKEKYFEEIGFVGIKSTIEPDFNFRNTKGRDGEYHEVTITNITDEVSEETFGLTVESGVYVTNGIVSHNTPLVHYPMTPMEYMERRTARNSYDGGRNIPKEFSARFKELGIRTKVNGFRHSTFLEQSIVDLGRSATPWLWNNIISQDIIVYSLRSAAKDEIVANLKTIVDPDTYFLERDPERYISSCHRIRIPLQGGYINQARELLKFGKDKPVTTRCIATYTGCKTKCYANAVPEGFKVYKDIKVDRSELTDGKPTVSGDFELVKGCGWCHTKEEKVARLKRRTDTTHTSDDIMAVPRRPKQLKMRFAIRRLPEYDILNPNNTSHSFVTKFLQMSDDLLHTYHSVESHTMYWSCDPEIPYYTSGLQLVDVIFTTKEVKDIIMLLIPEVNKSLKSIQIESVKEVFMEDKIKVNDLNVFRFETTFPLELFEASKISYRGEVRVVGPGGDNKLITIQDKTLEAPAFMAKGKVFGYFTLPLKYNPLLFMQGFLKDKKTPLSKIRESFIFDNKLVLRESPIVCRCGKETGSISMSTGTQLQFGKSCLAKALLKREMDTAKEVREANA